MFVYDILTKGGTIPASDSVQQAADAVVAVFPFLDPDTFNFKDQTNKPLVINEAKSDNKSGDQSKASKTRDIVVGGPYLLEDKILSLSIRSSKANHVSQTAIQLMDPNNELLSLTSPGDWVVIWITDNKNDAKLIRQKLFGANVDFDLNGFNSGLKFIGKVQTVRQNKQAMGDGKIARRAQMTCIGFGELDTHIYYDPLLFVKTSDVTFMAGLNITLNQKSGIPLALNSLLADYLSAFLGFTKKKLGFQGQNVQQHRPLRVPSVIGDILGLRNTRHYLEILRTTIGIQDYGQGNYMPSLAVGNQHIRGTSDKSPIDPPPFPTIRFTLQALGGFFSPAVDPFTNVPIWGILKQYSNAVVNEMYTALRVDVDNKIYPSLVIRQIPFNTDDFKNMTVSGKKVPHTPFRSLPRWKVSDPMILRYDTGKSNSLRVNFVHVWSTLANNVPTFASYQRGQVDPRVDATDIERNGLFAMTASVNAIYDFNNPGAIAKQWTSLVTDRMMGSHLKLSGSMSTTGIQAPIAVGDNLEYDGFCYHIEDVEHSIQVNPATGAKSFSTQLALSNGVPATGPVLPEVAVRTFFKNQEGQDVEVVSQVQHTDFPRSDLISDEEAGE